MKRVPGHPVVPSQPNLTVIVDVLITQCHYHHNYAELISCKEDSQRSVSIIIRTV